MNCPAEEVVEELRSLYEAFGPERFEQIMSGVSPETLASLIAALLDSGGGFGDHTASLETFVAAHRRSLLCGCFDRLTC